MRRPAVWTACALSIWAISPRLLAAVSTNDQIDKKIDEITAKPDYEWLREKNTKPLSQPPGAPGSGGTPVRARKPAGDPDDASCGYQPNKQKQERDANMPAGNAGGCGSGSPGARPAAPPPDTSSGCCNNTPGSSGCNCDPAIGNCGYNPSSCGCGPVGAIGGSVGWVVGALALAALVFLVVWLVASRDRRRNSRISMTSPIPAEPDAMRLSQLPETPFDQMMRRAEAAAAQGDYKNAVGWCYLAGIGALHRKGLIDLRISTTNLEIVDAIRRRSGPHLATARLVRIFEDLFFGDRKPGEDHWLESQKIARQDLA